MASVLIIDDDVNICAMLIQMVERIGHSAVAVDSVSAGLAHLTSQTFDIVLLDVMLPDGSGLDLLPKIRKKPLAPEVIIITGEGDQDGAELAVRNGAWDYLQKPFSPQIIILSLKRVIQYREDLKQRKQPAVSLRLDGIIGSSHQMKSCFDALAQAAGSDGNVIITGETGTGKELFARAIHKNSPRNQGPFVVVDCAALPETLVESTLFGHEKGAFTGAMQQSDGLIRQANGGTLFLDEIGELRLPLQKSFLRVLQERQFRPVGGRQEIKSNFRLIAATHRRLDLMAATGRFRKDLLYRLRVQTLELPPLRERTADIIEIVFHQMAKLRAAYGLQIKGLSPEFVDALHAYDWPGNIRELIHAIESAIGGATHEPVLFPKHLPIHIRVHLTRASVKRDKPSPKDSGAITPIAQSAVKPPDLFRKVREDILAEFEKKYFQDLMAYTNGNIKSACSISGLSRNRLYVYLKKHGVSRLGWR